MANKYSSIPNKSGNMLIPPMQPAPAVAGGMAMHNVDGRPIMGGQLVPGSGSAGGYGIAPMNQGAAKCAAFGLWMGTNIPYENGGLKVTTNWMPLSCQPGL